MALHIKTLQAAHEGARLYATLYLDRQDGQLKVLARITRCQDRGREALLGVAEVNKAGELHHLPADLTPQERDLLEAALAEALG